MCPIRQICVSRVGGGRDEPSGAEDSYWVIPLTVSLAFPLSSFVPSSWPFWEKSAPKYRGWRWSNGSVNESFLYKHKKLSSYLQRPYLRRLKQRVLEVDAQQQAPTFTRAHRYPQPCRHTTQRCCWQKSSIFNCYPFKQAVTCSKNNFCNNWTEGYRHEWRMLLDSEGPWYIKWQYPINFIPFPDNEFKIKVQDPCSMYSVNNQQCNKIPRKYIYGYWSWSEK